jgi:sucrose synthase
MGNLVRTIISDKDVADLREFISFLVDKKKPFLLRNEIMLAFEQYCHTTKKERGFREQSSIAKFFSKIQELFIRRDTMVMMYRDAAAKYRFYMLRNHGRQLEEISLSEFLDQRDCLALNGQHSSTHLHIDMVPFYNFYPSIRDTETIGNGIRFMNRYLCSDIFQNPDKWNEKLFSFLKLHKVDGRQLLINGSMFDSFSAFFNALENMLALMKKLASERRYSSVERTMKKAGFEAGWGNTAGRIVETMQLLKDLINEPNATQVEEFISRVPMPLISKVAIISPHGWFGQENVLGMPDTGGQVIYILDQVKALEKHLAQEIKATGLDVKPKIVVVTRLIPEAGNTTCDQRKEKIFQTENGWILRVPFKDRSANVVKQWISRFHVWPYLERFADDTATELLSEFLGRPDLIIGNYSDGNLVASLLSDKLDVIQCTVAHALEKTKYLFSDLYWKDMEKDYNFSLQFTADLLSMNKSDFIITSTAQEIVGTGSTIGQYESYQFFSMPGLFQVRSGINLSAPKFNVIPPGVDENLYFPYDQQERRIESQTKQWENRLFHQQADDIFGSLKSPDKIPIFTMARLDKIKNITGLLEAFGMSRNLQKACNLLFAAGTVHIEESEDAEEREEIKRSYELIEQYKLSERIRWLPSIPKPETGEVYRIIADHGGIFVQPALFEAFGLTILEAMASGLPTFGPIFGGPVETIEEGVSGFLLNTSKPELIAKGLEAFFDMCGKDKDCWARISKNGIKRVHEHFNWRSYSQRLIKLTKLYGLWRYSVSGPDKVKMDRYCDLIYHFLIKERAKRLESSCAD